MGPQRHHSRNPLHGPFVRVPPLLHPHEVTHAPQPRRITRRYTHSNVCCFVVYCFQIITSIPLRLNADPAWKGVAIMLSDATVPGEGEHKLVRYCRLLRAQPGYSPDTTHVIAGEDADLIFLGSLSLSPPHEFCLFFGNTRDKTKRGCFLKLCCPLLATAMHESRFFILRDQKFMGKGQCWNCGSTVKNEPPLPYEPTIFNTSTHKYI